MHLHRCVGVGVCVHVFVCLFVCKQPINISKLLQGIDSGRSTELKTFHMKSSNPKTSTIFLYMFLPLHNLVSKLRVYKQDQIKT